MDFSEITSLEEVTFKWCSVVTTAHPGELVSGFSSDLLLGSSILCIYLAKKKKNDVVSFVLRDQIEYFFQKNLDNTWLSLLVATIHAS